MDRLSLLDRAAVLLVTVGGINWGLVGLFAFDLVATLFGEMSGLSRLIYILVGIAGVYVAVITPALRRGSG